MADAGLFIGWGENISGRETKGLEVFAETLAYYAKLEADGKIESSEVALLEPHGGDLGGFILVRGSQDQMSALRADAEFERMTTRATLVVQGVGVVAAVLGEGLESTIATYSAAVDDIA